MTASIAAWLIFNGSMQTCGVYCGSVQSDALEAVFRTRYSGLCLANYDEHHVDSAMNPTGLHAPV